MDGLKSGDLTGGIDQSRAENRPSLPLNIVLPPTKLYLFFQNTIPKHSFPLNHSFLAWFTHPFPLRSGLRPESMSHHHEALKGARDPSHFWRSWCYVCPSGPAASCSGCAHCFLVYLSRQECFLNPSLYLPLYPGEFIVYFGTFGNKCLLYWVEFISGRESCKDLFPGQLEPEILSAQHQMKKGFGNYPSHWIYVDIQMGKSRLPHWCGVCRILFDICTIFLLPHFSIKITFF